ncbi:MAG TPA: class I tRNA ligase family protein, partial [Candidatus Saccharimonadales bacterium]
PREITCFTTRPDTNFGATFVVISPEHELAAVVADGSLRANDGVDRSKDVAKYIKAATAKTEVERQQEGRKKTGVFTGLYAVNTLNNKRLPIWVADFVLAGFGTGAVVGVPAHDERDYEFAKAFNLPIEYVVAPEFTDTETPPRQGVEFVERVAAQAIVKHPTDDTYLTLRLKGWDKELYGYPTGGLDEGEDAVAAATRELREETGLHNIAGVRQVGEPYYARFYHEYKKVNRRVKMYTVAIELKDLDRVAVADEEQAIHELHWMTADEVAQKVHGEGCKRMFEVYRTGDMGFVDEDGGIIINSDFLDGLNIHDATEKIMDYMEAKGWGKRVINYRMRDWSVSRQRYWGAPIPIVYCPKDGPVLVPDEQLPVVLPELEDFAPSGDGRSALARATDWLKVKCPTCGGDAERETDTLDTYICSSWYMYRYMDPHNQRQPFDPELVQKWEPVDFYNGADHATAHLLYARFIGHFFKRLGLVNEPEPFKQFLFNGKVTAQNGEMFSKSKGNGVDPLEIINQGYGADALRTYLMFAAPLEIWARWDPQGVPGTHRFLSRVWNLVGEYGEARPADLSEAQQKTIRRATHAMIRKITEDIEANRYNTAIAAAMACTNELYKLKTEAFGTHEVWLEALEALVACTAPFAPHISEELWFQLGHSTSIHRDTWPKWNEEYLVKDTVTVAVQVNGKLRGTVDAPVDADEAKAVNLAEADPKIAGYLDGKQVVKTIYVPAKLLNFVVK